MWNGGSELQLMTPLQLDPVDPLDPLDPVDPVACSKLVFYLSETLLFPSRALPDPGQLQGASGESFGRVWRSSVRAGGSFRRVWRSSGRALGVSIYRLTPDQPHSGRCVNCHGCVVTAQY